MSRELSLFIASPPDREKLVAEIWVGDDQVEEVNDEAGGPAIEIYPNPAGGPWRVSVSEFLNVLQEAARRALVRGDEAEKLTSTELSELIVDALLRAGLVSPEDVRRAISIATVGLDVRKAMGAY